MILPAKHVPADRSLVGVGARVVRVLDRPQTVSAIWRRFQDEERARAIGAVTTYDWFVLALDFLFAIGCVEIDGGQVMRVDQ